ncbi:efflux RND transporter periplasmic adaptor subunit [Chitinophaga silvisoli]|uniref:Efflux RND transporter periplasmic adaptor subunit n=1 Tax=Chitinophaga silvisoli TaxID=2291814 RepID=A0A3E1NTY3_9BACT|nr:efflux RND transporter periplasmic adaptor subunit [Chitinophaga silvisoli]RFM31401.1 efflux RND transporter periplasmic adaptor subunit [Chitinophaga silvisoli]
MKKPLIITTILTVAIACTALLINHKPARVVLSIEKATYGSISQSVTATGTIAPMDTVSVGTQVSGIISMINADFNSRVHKGQLLAQLDKSLLQATVDQNMAALATQQSTLAYNKSNFHRQEILYNTGSISKADYDLALNNYNAAVAGVANAEAQLRSARKNLSYGDILAPIDGVVLSRNVSIGQTVASSFTTPTLFVLAKDIKQMQVQADVDEADIGNIQKGERVSFTVDAHVDEEFKGTISDVRLQPRVSANVVTYTTIIYAPNDDLKLKPGMTANITIYTKEVNKTLLISSKALNYYPDSLTATQYKLRSQVHKDKSRYVWVQRGDSLIETAVRTGLDDNTHVQVISGISTKDSIITKP